MSGPPPALQKRVLILAPVGRDALLTQELLQQAGVPSDVCRGMDSMCAEWKRGAGAMIVAEEALAQQGASQLMRALEGEPPWSDPPLIVLTGRSAAEASTRMVSTLGTRASLVLLERPVRRVTLTAAVQSSLRIRQRQYETRDLLDLREKAVQERDQFLAILGHELRNPLATILTTLAVETGDVALAAKDREVISRQTRHLSRLIDDLLDVSRVTAGKIVLRQVPLDLREIARRGADALQTAMREHGHTLIVSLPDQPAYVMGDPARLEQVVTNLLTNAMKYTPEGGKIELSIATELSEAVLRVRDNGVGIPPSAMPQMFQPFMQIEQSLHRAQGGLGLGLALVRKLMQLQHGSVNAHSEGTGQGSEFTVRMPLTAAPAAPVATPAKTHGHARRVLLIEDVADARRAMGRLLKSWGHHLETAADGIEGVEKALASRPEIALIDIGLPGLDGFQVAQRLRAELGGQICLIALTGYGQPEDRRRTQSAGFDLHLVKPVEPAVLRDILNGPSCEKGSMKP